MPDNLGGVWNKFFGDRTATPWDRYSGMFRSLVVGTDDPLCMHRVRFKCPDLHDWSLRVEDCPWAVPSFDAGSAAGGRWAHPCIGDYVWIAFERGYPTAPVWVGMCSPTRRQQYALASVYTRTPVPVGDTGLPTVAPKDYQGDYLPRDGRPMSHGWQDRYGNLDIHSSVGFYPAEHAAQPPPPGHDAVQGGNYRAGGLKPVVNGPDAKYMARVTKYGNMMVLGDQGYYWQKSKLNPGTGEFYGDVVKDRDFETQRAKYLQRLLNEDVASSADEFGDQRRAGMGTRYGHVLELRDVGWGQPGPMPSKSRPEEYGTPVFVSQEKDNDFRWVKLRSGDGMLWQMMDKGSDPDKDLVISKPLIEKCGHRSEREDLYWKDKDARQIRTITRHGFKGVYDDRGSHPSDADGEETPRGNGILLKGRRTPGSDGDNPTGDQRGFYLEFNENDDLNHLTVGSPAGQVLELNDRYEYLSISTSVGRDYSAPWQRHKENEFLLEPARARQPELNSHHLVLDHANEYLRLKTRSGNGQAPFSKLNPVEAPGLQQGLEARDGSGGDGPWVELVDAEHRGLWFSKKEGVGVWRAKADSQIFQWMDDKNNQVVIYNGAEGGKVQIYCSGNVEVVGNNISVQAGGNLNIKASGGLNLEAGGEMNLKASKINLDGSGARFSLATKIMYDPEIVKGADPAAGADSVAAPQPPPSLEPTDRGKTYNDPYKLCPAEEVQHPT